MNILESDNIFISVDNLGKVFPKLSDEIKQEITSSYRNYKALIEKNICDDSNLLNLDDLIAYVDNSIKEVVIRKYNSDLINQINKYLPPNCIIDLTMISQEDEFRLFNSNIRSDLKFIDKYNNYKAKSATEILDSSLKILSIKEEISKYNLSVLEKIVFVADKVRSKPYKRNKDETAPNISRDLSDILDCNSDYIVCDGFSKLFSSIMNALGIYCERIVMVKKDYSYGHATNIIYINDDCYNIHGFFLIDITSFNVNNDSKFSHYNFLTSLCDAETILSKSDYSPFIDLSDNSDSIYCCIKNSLERLEIFKELAGLKKILLNEYGVLAKNMEKLADKINDKKLLDLSQKCIVSESNERIDKGEEMIELFNKYYKSNIDTDSLFSSIHQVRRIEYLNDPCKYEYSINKMGQIYNIIASNKDRLLNGIFGRNFFSIMAINNLNNIRGENALDKVNNDIKRLDLLRILKRELSIKEQKENNKVKVKIDK